MKRIFLIVFIAVALVSTVTTCSNNPVLPAFEEIDTQVYDTGAKSQIARHIVLQDSTISKEELTYLTETLVKASKNSKMKYNNGKPTHIFIYIHTTKDSFESGIWTNCIATYQKIGVNDEGKYTYR